MTEKITKIDFAYELIINTTNELGIQFKENMLDEVFGNIENIFSVEDLESPIDNKFVMEFSQALHDWTIVRRQFIK